MKFYCSNYRLILAPPRFLSFSPVPIIYSPSLSRSQQAFFAWNKKLRWKRTFPSHQSRVEFLSSCQSRTCQNSFLPASPASKPFPSCQSRVKTLSFLLSCLKTFSFLPVTLQNPFLPANLTSKPFPSFYCSFKPKPFPFCQIRVKTIFILPFSHKNTFQLATLCQNPFLSASFASKNPFLIARVASNLFLPASFASKPFPSSLLPFIITSNTSFKFLWQMQLIIDNCIDNSYCAKQIVPGFTPRKRSIPHSNVYYVLCGEWQSANMIYHAVTPQIIFISWNISFS